MINSIDIYKTLDLVTALRSACASTLFRALYKSQPTTGTTEDYHTTTSSRSVQANNIHDQGSGPTKQIVFEPRVQVDGPKVT